MPDRGREADSPASGEGTPIAVSVVYLGPEEQLVRSLEVPAGTTLGGAIERSGVLERCPEIDLRASKVGIWGRLARLDQPLGIGDRVEIYRPLIADPREARKRRAEGGEPMRRGTV